MKHLSRFLLISTLLMLSACGSSYMKASSALRNGELQLSDYDKVVMTKYKSVLFMELELETLLEEQGLEAIGKNTAKQLAKNPHNKILKARYRERSEYNGPSTPAGTSLTILLEDYTTGKALLSIRGNQVYGNRQMAWNRVARKLRAAFNGNYK